MQHPVVMSRMGDSKRLGLVLSGGGAKGAYQVGIVKVLAEMNVEIAAISGASIGALNGAIVATSPSLREAADRLEHLWRTLAEHPPIRENESSVIRMLEAMGLEVNPSVRSAAMFAHEVSHNLISTLKSPETESLVDTGEIRKLMDEYISPERLASGLPLYVSVFPNRNYLESVIGSSLAALGIRDNPKSEFLLIQSLPEVDRKKALLASSAIPFLFDSQEIGGARYLDGGLGGLFSSQGNTPIEPLLDNGYAPVIVTSLSDRGRWARQKRADVELIVVEREDPIGRAPILPMVFDIISFLPDSIHSWIEQGYHDAKRSLEKYYGG